METVGALLKLAPGQLWLVRLGYDSLDAYEISLSWFLLVLGPAREINAYDVIVFPRDFDATRHAGLVRTYYFGQTFSMESIASPAQKMHTYELISDA